MSISRQSERRGGRTKRSGGMIAGRYADQMSCSEAPFETMIVLVLADSSDPSFGALMWKSRYGRTAVREILRDLLVVCSINN